MPKVVYNGCYGGFNLSAAAVRQWKELAPNDPHWIEVTEAYGDFAGPRHDPTLVRVVEEMGDAASGQDAKLRIADVPSGKLYRIDEHDGKEFVNTVDSYDWTLAP
jgi:hypothetical protein